MYQIKPAPSFSPKRENDCLPFQNVIVFSQLFNNTFHFLLQFLHPVVTRSKRKIRVFTGIVTCSDRSPPQFSATCHYIQNNGQVSCLFTKRQMIHQCRPPLSSKSVPPLQQCKILDLNTAITKSINFFQFPCKASRLYYINPITKFSPKSHFY